MEIYKLWSNFELKPFSVIVRVMTSLSQQSRCTNLATLVYYIGRSTTNRCKYTYNFTPYLYLAGTLQGLFYSANCSILLRNICQKCSCSSVLGKRAQILILRKNSINFVQVSPLPGYLINVSILHWTSLDNCCGISYHIQLQL